MWAGLCRQFTVIASIGNSESRFIGHLEKVDSSQVVFFIPG
jgi:hypothetical protein